MNDWKALALEAAVQFAGTRDVLGYVCPFCCLMKGGCHYSEGAVGGWDDEKCEG